MKAIRFVIFIMLFSLVSCSLFKRTVKTEDTQQTTKVELKKDSQEVVKTDIKSAVFTENELKLIESKTEEFNSHLILYDTSLPVDEKTGRPPIKAEMIKNSNVNYNADKQLKFKQNAVLEDKSEKKLAVKSELKTDTKIKKRIKETNGIDIGALIIGIAIVVLLLFLYLKIIKKFSLIGFVLKMFKK